MSQIRKCHAIIPGPTRAALSKVAFGGPDRDVMCITARDKVFRRRVKTKGVQPVDGSSQADGAETLTNRPTRDGPDTVNR